MHFDEPFPRSRPTRLTGFPIRTLALALIAQGLAFVSQVAAQQQPTIQITSPPSDITLVTGSSVTLAASVSDPDNTSSPRCCSSSTANASARAPPAVPSR